MQIIRVSGWAVLHCVLTCWSCAPRQSSIKIQQILTTAEHLWAESGMVYQVRNLSLWIKTGQNSVGVSSNHQEWAGRKSSLLRLHSMEGLHWATPLGLSREQNHIIYETPVKIINRPKIHMFKKILYAYFGSLWRREPLNGL